MASRPTSGTVTKGTTASRPFPKRRVTTTGVVTKGATATRKR